MSTEKDFLQEVAYYARNLVEQLRETYDVGDLDEDIEAAMEELENKLVDLDEYESEEELCTPLIGSRIRLTNLMDSPTIEKIMRCVMLTICSAKDTT